MKKAPLSWQYISINGVRGIFALVLLFMFLGCGAYHGALDSHRRRSYISDNPQLTKEQRKDVLKGRLQTGMTKEMVRASLGEPIETSAGTTTWTKKVREKWFYDREEETMVVEFEDGRVVGWTQKRKGEKEEKGTR
jgi:hypothetical protein